MACAGYLGYPFQNKRVKSCVENLARHVGKEEKFGMVIIISAFYGTDIQNSQHRSLSDRSQYPVNHMMKVSILCTVDIPLWKNERFDA